MAAIKNDKMGFNMNTTSAPSPEILETANAFVDDVIKEAEEIARKKKVFFIFIYLFIFVF
ncbi:hypothetical protein O3M35_008868 [Rhynocoris fuscipes]|uniref:Uncharacterized protein n=1 Tax=Rhynocoris fuscipes TaxID=488301 RepID=A0AAW1DAC7_9HEMI